MNKKKFIFHHKNSKTKAQENCLLSLYVFCLIIMSNRNLQKIKTKEIWQKIWSSPKTGFLEEKNKTICVFWNCINALASLLCFFFFSSSIACCFCRDNFNITCRLRSLLFFLLFYFFPLFIRFQHRERKIHHKIFF